MMNTHFDRALLLYQQARYAQAEQELRQALADYPNDARSIAMLAICISHLRRYPEATQLAQEAIATAPDLAFAHYAQAYILQDRGQLPKAEQAITEALRLDPLAPSFYVLLAEVKFGQQQWQAALTAAEKGLQLDPRHRGCLNLRSMALIRLNRIEMASSSIEETLHQHPDDALSHANQGWLLLEKRRYTQAAQAFREALQLDPTLDWARSGMIQALKAQNPIYGVMIRYFLWMSKLDTRTRWMIVVGSWFVVRVLRNIARANPSFAPFVVPIIGIYFVFVLLTWVADPLFNLLLRLNRYGRLILAPDEIQASNWVGGSIGLALVAGLLLLVTQNIAAGVALFVFGLLIVPLAATFHCSGRSRQIMAIYTSVVTVIGIIGIFLALIQGALTGLAGLAAGLFFLGVYASSWIANVLMMRRSPR